MTVTVTIHSNYPLVIASMTFGTLPEFYVTANDSGDLIFDVTLPDGTYNYVYHMSIGGQTQTFTGTYTITNPVPPPPPPPPFPWLLVAVGGVVAVGLGYFLLRH